MQIRAKPTQMPRISSIMIHVKNFVSETRRYNQWQTRLQNILPFIEKYTILKN